MLLLTLRGIFTILLHFRLSYKNALPEIVIQKQAITGLPKSSFSNRGLVQSPLKIVFHCHSRLAYFHIEIVASGLVLKVRVLEFGSGLLYLNNKRLTFSLRGGNKL